MDSVVDDNLNIVTERAWYLLNYAFDLDGIEGNDIYNT